MGNTTSLNNHQNGGAKNLYKMMKEQPSHTVDTINFKRNDLANTLSDRSIMDAIHKESVKVSLPTRNRYSKLETQQLKNKNSNLIGGNQMTPVSEYELSAIKNLVLYGGCGCENKLMTGGCGCAVENRVLNSVNLEGGFNGSATSSFMPQTMDLSATSVTNGTATSSFMPQTMDLSATSVTNGIVTSSFMPQTMDLSATSVTVGGSAHSAASVTSSFMPQTIELSATSATMKNTASSKSESVLNSAMDRLIKIANVQLGGVKKVVIRFQMLVLNTTPHQN